MFTPPLGKLNAYGEQYVAVLTKAVPGKVMMELPALSERVVDLSNRRKDDCVCLCTKMSLAKTAFHPTIGSHSSSAFMRY